MVAGIHKQHGRASELMKATLLYFFSAFVLTLGFVACGLDLDDLGGNSGSLEGAQGDGESEGSGDDSNDEDSDRGCVEVCHIPRGNPDNAHTICVGEPAVSAHVGRHGGDFLGRCDPCEFPDSDDGDSDDDSSSDSDDDSSGDDGDDGADECALACQAACEDSTDPDRAEEFYACLQACKVPPECGDGDLNETAGEECDEAGQTPTCDDDCTFVHCGDGNVNEDAGEECDDGNNDDGDGCASDCQTEDDPGDCDTTCIGETESAFGCNADECCLDPKATCDCPDLTLFCSAVEGCCNCT